MNKRTTETSGQVKVLLFANTDWYLYNFRRSFALSLRDAGYEVLLVSPDGPYGAKLRELGLHWLPAPMNRRSLNPLRELFFVNWLRRLLKQEGVDLVHGFTIKCAVYGALAARLAGDRARISAVAGMGYVFVNNHLKARLLRPVVRVLLRMALMGSRSRLILQNPDDFAFFERERLSTPKQMRLILSSGVDCNRFYPVLKEGYRAEPLKVLLPARLLWDKGVGEFVEASRSLKSRGAKIDFLLAGDPDDGNPSAVPEMQIRAWETEGLIKWLGHVDDMPELYRSVDLVALPSYREGVPKSLIEASACGKPVITTDAPGCREVVVDGQNGFLIPVKDAHALANAIAKLDDSEELRVKMGAKARQIAIDKFDEKIVLSQTLDVYDELLHEAGNTN